MASRITDPDVALLAALSGGLEADYAPDDLEWEGSPFAWIKSRPSRQIGAIGEKLVAGWCAARDLDVTRSPNSDADRVIGGKRCEIKFSTRWKNGVYKFQQIRDQDYDFAILLGVCPFDAHAWVVPKTQLLAQKGQPGSGMTGQHARGEETAWLSFPHDSPPAWLRPHGGKLATAGKLMQTSFSQQ